MNRAFGAALVALVVAGCSAPIAGRPIADSDSPTSATAVRPHPIDLEGRQRCLLSQTQWPEFAIEKDGDLVTRDRNPQGRQCFYDTNVGYFGYLFNTTDGVEYWTTTPTSDRIVPTDRVLGFPALERTGSADTGRCDLIIDVADGQALDVFASIDQRSAANYPPACAVARRLAEIAITELTR
jgi:hypothetical protein